MVFRKGHGSSSTFSRATAWERRFIGTTTPTYNIGAQNSVHTGGERQSYLVLPVIPS